MKIFIGSSKQSLETARFVATIIEEANHTPQIWNDPGLFIAGSYTTENLERISKDVDAAMFIFNEDDKQWLGNEKKEIVSIVRDNVIFELGLFAGRLSLKNVCFCCLGNPKIATDLSGVTFINLEKRNAARNEIIAWINTLKILRETDNSPRVVNRGYKVFENEKKANSELAELLRSTRNSFGVMSRAGATIFYLFREYISLMKKPNARVNVLIANPNNPQLVHELDYFAIENDVRPNWQILLSDINSCLVNQFGLITEYGYDKLVKDLIDYVRRATTYKQVIIASHIMWLIAAKVADYQNMSINVQRNLDSLGIYYMDNLSRIKLWLSDDCIGAFGGFNVHALGSHNPVEFYCNKNIDDTASYDFYSYYNEWKTKLEQSSEQKCSYEDSKGFYDYCASLLLGSD